MRMRMLAPVVDVASGRTTGQEGRMTLYRTIVVDPPWHYRTFGGFNGPQSDGVRREVRRVLPYQSMTVAQIAALGVTEMAHPAGANVFLWTTNRYLPHSFDVLAAWGASYSQTLVWHKTGANPTTGHIAPTSCEYLIHGRIGKAVLTGKLADSLLTTKRLASRHSAKPETWLDEIERVSPGPYMELFARRNRLGWDTWGDQALNHVEIAS